MTRNAETVLNVIRERGERGLPLENIYRLLYNRNLYLWAYGRIYSNQGATTKGITAETLDHVVIGGDRWVSLKERNRTSSPGPTRLVATRCCKP